MYWHEREPSVRRGVNAFHVLEDGRKILIGPVPTCFCNLREIHVFLCFKQVGGFGNAAIVQIFDGALLRELAADDGKLVAR